jgi:hypothetical protein
MGGVIVNDDDDWFVANYEYRQLLARARQHVDREEDRRSGAIPATRDSDTTWSRWRICLIASSFDQRVASSDVLHRRRKKTTHDMFGRRIPQTVRVTFRRDPLAEALWQYGEDELAEAALGLSEDDLHQVQLLAVWHHETTLSQ